MGPLIAMRPPRSRKSGQPDDEGGNRCACSTADPRDAVLTPALIDVTDIRYRPDEEIFSGPSCTHPA